MPGIDSSDQHDRDLARTTTIVLAEFAGLRSEIATRINLQVTLILGNLTVLGVVLGVVLGIALNRPGSTNVPGNVSVLLVLPLVTPCIGLLYVDQFRNLHYLGQYIHRFIRPQLQLHSQLKIDGVEVFGWERWIVGRQFTPWGGSSRRGSPVPTWSRCSLSFSAHRLRS